MPFRNPTRTKVTIGCIINKQLLLSQETEENQGKVGHFCLCFDYPEFEQPCTGVYLQYVVPNSHDTKRYHFVRLDMETRERERWLLPSCHVYGVPGYSWLATWCWTSRDLSKLMVRQLTKTELQKTQKFYKESGKKIAINSKCTVWNLLSLLSRITFLIFFY